MSGLLDLAPMKMPLDPLEAYCVCRTMKFNRDACIYQNSLYLPTLPFVIRDNLLLSNHQR